MKVRALAVSLLTAILSFQPKPALASGAILHIFMVDEATQQIPDNALKDFLTRHKNLIRNGSIFPDSGYVTKSYGEFAHWEGFLNAYARYLDERCIWPLSAQCEKLFAFFMGSLSHSVADVNFDRYFVQELGNKEFSGSSVEAQKYTDFGVDMLAIMEHQRGLVIPSLQVPVEPLLEILNQNGRPVSRAKMRLSLELQHSGLLGEIPAAPLTYLYYKYRSRWAPANYYAAKGGVQDTASVIADFWQRCWAAVQNEHRFIGLTHFAKQGSWPNIDLTLN